jgi:oligopeptide/dipeptide ABC transporter ATP-binding protein
MSLLEVNNLSTSFFTRDGEVEAVGDVSFSVDEGQVLGVVGESGCGKSVTALSMLGLLPKPGVVKQGEVLFKGRNLVEMKPEDLKDLRGKEVSMIFQQPGSALNPVYKVGAQIAEVFKLHSDIGKEERNAAAIDMLRKVGIPDPESRAKSYPHEMSGGMAQRVMIAMALSQDPQLLIADEPTTALDVTIQAQILDLMRGLKANSNTAVVLISHDLGVIAEMADRVLVMYAGQVVEEADVETLFSDPHHPYTKGLIGSIPTFGDVRDELDVIPGIVPGLIDPPNACRFAPRCIARIENELEICTQQVPELIQVGPNHNARCFLYSEKAT